MNHELRKIPSVEKVLQSLPPVLLPRPVVVDLVRQELATLRQSGEIPELTALLERIQETVAVMERSRIQPVINGTGVIVHTNLGRAPLGLSTISALSDIAGHYSNLEIDLTSGERGSRGIYLERLLATLCQAEAATVVNNCAAALVLTLRHFTQTKPEVIISRGELVQIGGGFRIPDILQASGAKLVEIGTTNRTTVADYEAAISKQTGLILKVHQSNFYMGGFVEAAAPEELAALARRHDIPLVHDLGSGAVFDTSTVAGVEKEPTPAEALREGADVVCFSGDKLFGGPQAGIIAGKKRWIAALKREPFFRALRCDKLVLTALQTTVEVYVRGGVERDIDEQVPLQAMLHATVDQLRERAAAVAHRLGNLPLDVKIRAVESRIGGGTLPRSAVPSIALELRPREGRVDDLAKLLRCGRPPVVGYISEDRYLLDFRTIFPEQDEQLAEAVRMACQPNAPL